MDNQPTIQERQTTRCARPLAPPVDLYEDSTGYVLFADVPGVKAEDIEIHIEGDQLVVRGRMSPLATTPTYAEFAAHDYQRAFQVHQEIDRDQVRAKLTDGVLRLDLPKPARAQARKIPVLSN